MLNNIIVTDVKDIFTVSSPKGRFNEITNRYAYGLSFCTCGKITYTHNGRNFVSDRNHAVILPQGQSYTLYGNETGIFPVINFTCMDFLCDTLIILPLQNPELYINDYEQMKALFPFEGNRAKIMSIFYNMLYRLSAQNNVCSLILPAIKYIEDNYQNPDITNAKLAEKCNISEVYFRRLFLKQYKITPKQFIIDIRIGKAKQLLTEGALKISAVAERCGFSNPYHFCRMFKEKTGLTPTEYINQKWL